MLRFLSNIPIFRRIFLLFLIAAFIPAIVIISLSNFYLSDLSNREQAIRTSFDAQNIAAKQQNNLQRMNASLQARHDQVFASLSSKVQGSSLAAAGGLISTDIAAREAEFNGTLNSYAGNYEISTSSNMNDVRNILLNDNAATGSKIISDQQQAISAVSGINGLWSKYKVLQDDELNQLRNLEANPPLTTTELRSKYDQAYLTLLNANNTFTDLRNNWQKIVDEATVMGKTVASVGSSVTTPIIGATLIAVLATVIILLLTGWSLNLTISNPLRGLASLTRRISKGDTSARAKVLGRDEIALVANSMNSMLDNIVHLIQDTQAQRDNLQSQVEKLVSEVSGVGDGDLRVQAEVTADALGVLADSFNYMVEELGSLIVRVKLVANEVDNSTVMILDRMTQLVESGDVQINQITEAAIEIERMSASSRQVAERSQVLYDVARDARQDAQGGREAVEQAVEGMGRINDNVQLTASKVQDLGERSREIDEIVAAISSIAHQTNRLALDAAIQAAMAGENGKGFGAVAADIRRLAERAKEQVSSITKIVRNVREEVGAVAISMQDTERETRSGTRLTREAGVALEAIFTAVEQQAREIENINKVAIQQLQSSSSIVQIMHGVSESTQQSGASTRDASQSMERLARLVEQLRSSVEAFKLRENQGYFVPNANVSMEEEQESQLTVSGIFRTVSGGTPQTQLSGVGFPSNALPAARSNDPFPGYPITPNQQYNGNGYDNDRADYRDQEPWYNEPFTPNGNGRNR
ncbi:MAG: hypothetical protein NVSMB38_11440 [Ktedonobacteraceae bacterium]